MAERHQSLPIMGSLGTRVKGRQAPFSSTRCRGGRDRLREQLETVWAQQHDLVWRDVEYLLEAGLIVRSEQGLAANRRLIYAFLTPRATPPQGGMGGAGRAGG